MFRSILSIIQAFLFLISSFSVADSSFKEKVDLAAVSITSNTDFSFDNITAEETMVTAAEREKCRDWYKKNILGSNFSDFTPAYDFTIGGKSFRKNIKSWAVSVGKESKIGEKYSGGKTTYITLTHQKSGIVATVEATIYEEYATCEWTVFLKNNSDDNSPVIKDFYGINCTLPIKNSDIYFSKGSAPDSDDFELYKSSVNNLPMKFSANGGRNDSFLPYFNLCGKDTGILMCVGWTGQWCASFEQSRNGVEVKAKQEKFKAYLTPGEEIRSPLVSLTFSNSGNPLNGFNTLRSWENNCIYPESIEVLNGYVIANEFCTLTCDQLIDMVNNVNKDVLKQTDYFWMDAGWYKYTEAWHDGVGNWVPDEKRFPDGLKPLADAISAKGKKFLLWYEPERVREGTVLYNEGIKHDDWIVQIGSDLLWNLGSDEACEYLGNYIAKSLVANGVTIYRQDFNFTPSPYWEKADKNFYDGRTGICENHYVSNLYKYLDKLCTSVDGLIIDNCASGGKRLDLEMTRRSLPLWRSDYNCGNADGTIKEDVLEATQSMTYGLSCWMVYSGTNRYFHSEYASRSAVLTNQSVYEPSVTEYNKYRKVSEYMTENYYPVTYGGTETDKILAMQFGNGNEGSSIIYIRENVTDTSYMLKYNGLSENKTYIVYDIDNPDVIYTKSGKQLAKDGIEIRIKETPKAVIMMYKEAK